MSLLSKLTYMFYAVLISIPTKFCCKHRHANSNIFMERQRQILQKKKVKWRESIYWISRVMI